MVIATILADPNLHQALEEGVTAVAEDAQRIGGGIHAAVDRISGLWNTAPSVGGVSEGVNAAVDSIPGLQNNTVTNSERVRIMDAALTPALQERERILASMNTSQQAMANARNWARQQVGTISSNDTRNHTVYVIQRRGIDDIWYVGRTIDYTSRQRSHQRGVNARFPETNYRMSPIATNLTGSEARALEQTLIAAFTLDALNNKINSIVTCRAG